ncbi:hypothetical protein B7463_g8722, partial [Scytalidium lignicola]
MMAAEKEYSLQAEAVEIAQRPPAESKQEFEYLVATEVDLVELTEEEKKRVVRKLDWIFIPQITWLYILSYLDRGNIGNAKIAGMATDLNLHGSQYNVALMVFFICYGLFEVPSNIVLKLVRPSMWISSLMIAWEVITTLTCLVKSYEGLVTVRFLLGISEAGFWPGVVFLLTLWYTRYEVQKRMAIVFCGASLAGAFSGLLAYAIVKMDGIAGLAGWRWIYLLEGIITVISAVVILFTLPDSPQHSRFLTEREKKFCISRLQIETGSGQGRVTNEDRISVKYVMAALKEWKIWMGVVAVWGNSVTVYGFTYTVPSVINQLGYSASNAQLMTVPIYIFCMLGTLGMAIASDRVKQRSPFVIGGFLSGSLGFIALLAIPHPKYPGVTYGFLFLAAFGIYAPIVPLVRWFANNLAPSSKRAVGTATILTMAALFGGFAGSNMFPDYTAPHYYPGYSVSFAIMLIASLAAYILRRSYDKLNRERDLMTEEEIRTKYSEGELLAMGDESPFFRYTL